MNSSVKFRARDRRWAMMSGDQYASSAAAKPIAMAGPNRRRRRWHSTRPLMRIAENTDGMAHDPSYGSGAALQDMAHGRRRGNKRQSAPGGNISMRVEAVWPALDAALRPGLERVIAALILGSHHGHGRDATSKAHCARRWRRGGTRPRGGGARLGTDIERRR